MADLLALIARVRADEREKCAAVCEELESRWLREYRIGHKTDAHLDGMSDGAGGCAVAIRERKEQG